MVKTIMEIEGMACNMCEAHVNDAVRKAFPGVKVTSSYKKARTEVVSDGALDEKALREAVEATGYGVKGISAEPYEKKRFSLFGK